MDLIQIIGFVVVMIMMSLLSRRRKKERTRSEYPEPAEEDAHKQKQNLKQFLKSLDMDMKDDEEDEHAPLPEPPPVKKAPLPPPPPPRAFMKETKPAHKPDRLVQEGKYQFEEKFDAYALTSPLDQRKYPTDLDKRYGKFPVGEILSPDMQSSVNNYKTYVSSKPSKGKQLVEKIASKKDMVVYQEIMNPPLSLRRPLF